jgi:Raf kinase inhibitor-like YbhB/YbcL family protein
MKIISSVFDDGEYIPVQYTCLGKGINPPLTWSQVPVNTKTLALIVDDPDAPGGVFCHWVLWDIPVAISEVSENSLPLDAVVGVGSSGANQYMAPCPPTGVHHYRFKLYALDKELFLSVNSKQTDLEEAMSGHILAQATLVGLFKK